MLVLTRKIPAEPNGRADNVLTLTVGDVVVWVSLCGLTQSADGLPQCKVLVDAPKHVVVERPDMKKTAPTRRAGA